MLSTVKSKAAVVGTALAALSTQAIADVPPEVTTAITGAGVDSKTIASAVLVVIVALFAFKLMRKAL